MKRFAVAWLLIALPVPAAAGAAETPGYAGEIKAVVDKVLAAYRSATTYQDRVDLTLHIEMESDAGSVPEQTDKLRLAYARPDRIALVVPGRGVFTDGKRSWDHRPHLDQYVVGEAPKRIDLKAPPIGPAMFVDLPHPIAWLLTESAKSDDAALRPIVKFTGLEADKVDGDPERRLSGVVRVPLSEKETAEVPFTAWIRASTHLLARLDVDMTKPFKDVVAPEPMASHIKKVTVRYTFHDVARDGAIPAARFEFKPSLYDEKVAAFRPVSPEARQGRLLGRPAPDFTGKTIAGKTVALHALRGKVVVLDFWATWCGPCMMSMPGMQKLADAYDDEKVLVLGINGDDPGAAHQVKSFLDKRKLVYPQVLDAAGRISDLYRVSGIPCVILVGKNGLVQAIHRGYSPNQHEELKSQIGRLLGGKNLVTPVKRASAARPDDTPIREAAAP
jgi:thiol-disulfide isomerase/thioredoxin